jgi:hypothetical protein
MLPSRLTFNGVDFRLVSSNDRQPNAMTANGQTISLPRGSFNRVYIVSASAEGDEESKFRVGGKDVELNIQNWGGFIGQWDDREWGSIDEAHDHYGDVIGIKPGYIKRADLAGTAPIAMIQPAQTCLINILTCSHIPSNCRLEPRMFLCRVTTKSAFSLSLWLRKILR